MEPEARMIEVLVRRIVGVAIAPDDAPGQSGNVERRRLVREVDVDSGEGVGLEAWRGVRSLETRWIQQGRNHGQQDEPRSENLSKSPHADTPSPNRGCPMETKRSAAIAVD